MFKTLKNALRSLTLAIAICAPAVPAAVAAQTYIRPSKGKPIIVFNAPVNSNLGPSYANPSTCTVSGYKPGCILTCPSTLTVCGGQVLDMSAFSGFNVTVNRLDTAPNCKYGLRTTVFQTPDPTGKSATAAQARNGYRNTATDDTWYVPVSAPYAFVTFEAYSANPTGADCLQKVSVTVTPTAVDPVQEQSTTTWNWEVRTFLPASCRTFSFSGQTPAARIQNLSGMAVKCGVPGLDGSAPAGFPIYLKADSAVYPNSVGDGGTFELKGYMGALYCCGVGLPPATATIGVFQN